VARDHPIPSTPSDRNLRSPVARIDDAGPVTGYLPYLALTVSIASAAFSYRSSRTARRQLVLASKTGQAAYEVTRLTRVPPLDLVVTSVAFRDATAIEYDDEPLLAAESAAWAEGDIDHIEVVVRGRIKNSLGQELLLTLRDHPQSRREVWYEHRNHSNWCLDDGRPCRLGQLVLAPDADHAFTWIDRRHQHEWEAVYLAHSRSRWQDEELSLPRLRIADLPRLLRRPTRDHVRFLRKQRLPRVGFRVIAEPRTQERVAAVWTAEVTKAPLFPAARRESDHPLFEKDYQIFEGPVDDDVVYYRLGYDTALASINRPSLVYVPGRIQ